MGTLTLIGIIVGGIGAAATGVGGVFIAVDAAQKAALKVAKDWKAEAEKNIKDMEKQQNKE